MNSHEYMKIISFLHDSPRRLRRVAVPRGSILPDSEDLIILPIICDEASGK